MSRDLEQLIQVCGVQMSAMRVQTSEGELWRIRSLGPDRTVAFGPTLEEAEREAHMHVVCYERSNTMACDVLPLHYVYGRVPDGDETVMRRKP